MRDLAHGVQDRSHLLRVHADPLLLGVESGLESLQLHTGALRGPRALLSAACRGPQDAFLAAEKGDGEPDEKS